MKLKLAGKEFELKSMTLNQVAELEEKGINLMEFGKEGSFKMSYIRDIMYVVVKDQTPLEDMSDNDKLKWIGDNVNMDNFAEVSKKITNFLTPKSGQAKART